MRTRFGVSGVLVVLMFCTLFARGQTVSIMPLGDSITVGVDYATHWTGGYRDPLLTKLKAMKLTPQFVGASSSNPTEQLTSTANQFHNGYGAYPIQALTDNLDANKPFTINGQPYGDSNQGGFWITGGHDTGRQPAHPDFVLLEIGTNDFLQGVDIAHINQRLKTLVTTLHTLSPKSIVLAAGAIPINNNPGFNANIKKYDLYIKTTLAPALSYVRYVDMYSAFTKADGSTISDYYGTDNIHPSATGYPAMATAWAAAIGKVAGEKK
jgi:lysophospholipase L1-like esterase